MKYLDEVGHLGGLDPRISVNLGIARVFAEPEGQLRFEGRDSKRMRWRVWIPEIGGVGGTDVWTADFDRNGRKDLLIAAMFPKNGRCVDGLDIYTLMFDEGGRPVPWMAHSNSFADFGRAPVAITAGKGGRAEIVTVSCEYSDPATGAWEDRRVSGIYEASDARWHPMRNVSDVPYLAAAKRQVYGGRPGSQRWLPTDPAQWPDFLSGYDAQPTMQLRSILTAGVGCGGVVRFSDDGRVLRPNEDPCEALRYNRAVYSDGKTRRGWPFVVIDSPDGRDVFLADPITALMNVLKMGYRFKILGDSDSPALLWVDTRAGAQPAQVSCRLQTGEPKSIPPTPQQLSRISNRAEIKPSQFEPVPGTSGSIDAAVLFNRDWLVEWHSGPRHWLVLHSATGKPLTTEMALPVDGELFGSRNYDGLYFIKRTDGQPTGLIVIPTSVEWSTALP